MRSSKSITDLDHGLPLSVCAGSVMVRVSEGKLAS